MNKELKAPIHIQVDNPDRMRKLKFDQVIYPKVLIFCLARALGYPAPKGLLPRKFGKYARTTFVPLQLGH